VDDIWGRPREEGVLLKLSEYFFGLLLLLLLLLLFLF
jgi:hypothetical protein